MRVFQLKVTLRNIEPPMWRRIEVREDCKLSCLHRILQLLFNWEDYHLHDFIAGQDEVLLEVLLEAILPLDSRAFYPRCTVGARNGLPEDAGGPFGYLFYLEALADRKHERHREMLAWRGPFEPEAFQVNAINASLKRSITGAPHGRGPGRRAPDRKTGN